MFNLLKSQGKQRVKSLISTFSLFTLVSFTALLGLGNKPGLYSDSFTYSYAPRQTTQSEINHRAQVVEQYQLRGESDLPTPETVRSASCAVLRKEGKDNLVSYCKPAN